MQYSKLYVKEIAIWNHSKKNSRIFNTNSVEIVKDFI